MAKVRVKANKLENPTVRYISLVQRGANRIPFRIIKLDKEKEMTIDLGSMFKRVQKSEPAATTTEDEVDTSETTVAALVIEKSDQNVEEILKSAGFDVGNKTTGEDGTVVYTLAEVADGEQTHIFKMSDGLLAIVKGFDDSTMPANIKEFAKTEGFYPEMDFVAMVAKSEGAIGDIRAYTDILEATLPVSIFKAAADIDALVEKMSDSEDEEEMDEEDEEEPPKKKAKSKSKKSDESDAGDEGDAGAEALVALIQKAVEDGIAELKKDLTEELGEVQKQVTDLSTQVSGITEQGQTLTTKMAEVEKVAKAAADKIKGTVVGGLPSGDRDAPITVTKSEDPRSGLFDTAFLPRRTSVSKVNRR